MANIDPMRHWLCRVRKLPVQHGSTRTLHKSSKKRLGLSKRPKVVTWVPILFITFAVWEMTMPTETTRELTWQDFCTKFLNRGLVDSLVVVNDSTVRIVLRPEALGFAPPGSYYFSIGSPDTLEHKLEKAQEHLGIPASEYIPVSFHNLVPLSSILLHMAPWLLFLGFVVYMRRNVGGGGASSLFDIGKSRAKLFQKETAAKITFKNVAGAEEAKEEIMEFVKFLKNPASYERLGATIPKGAILSGPPGTGKTLFARATASEVGVPYLSISGSEFMDMVAGVGPSRVRDLFTTAKNMAPCIIFIDEIDAIGKARGKAGQGTDNEERESTLNQLLVEMDGFNSNEHVFVLAGTNRPDVLDSALLRPGRFDRHIVIDRPDIQGRTQIFKVHLRPVVTDVIDVDTLADKLAVSTPGFTGADIRNVCNEAALIAARRMKQAVTEADFEQAIERMMAGIEKRSRVLSLDEKTVVAYHEAGHAVAGWFLEHTKPPLKVSIIPRGTSALGYTQHLPKDQFLYSAVELFDQMCMILGGRVAEQLFFDSITTGAQDDLQKVTKMAYAQISRYGMNPKIGPLSYHGPDEEQCFRKSFSEVTAEMIDEEVRKLVQQALERTEKLLAAKKESVEKVAKLLLSKETISRQDLERLINKQQPFSDKSDS